MNLDHLTVMANQIGNFFESMPDRAEALKGIADHIHKFWAPRMRSAILHSLDSPQGALLSPMVREALSLHRQELEPAAA
jgi:formate dehydrogenase subunit delta